MKIDDAALLKREQGAARRDPDEALEGGARRAECVPATEGGVGHGGILGPSAAHLEKHAIPGTRQIACGSMEDARGSVVELA